MHKEFDIEKSYALRLPHDGDMLEELNKFAKEHDIKNGFVSVIGAVKCVTLGFYEQDNRKYIEIKDEEFDTNRGLEIVSATGNISLKDDTPFNHIHVVVADEKGKCFAGHLMAGTKIFAGEAIIQKFKGSEDLSRAFDEETGLPLWKK